LPLIGRVFTPAQFGVYSLLVSATGLVAPAVSMRLEAAVLLPSDHGEASALARLALAVSFGMSAVGGVVIWVLIRMGPLAGLGGLPFAPLWATLTLALGGVFAVFGGIALRERMYRPIATRSVLQNVASACLQVAAGLLKLGSIGLVAGATIGKAVGIAALAAISRPYLASTGAHSVSRVARVYWRYPAVFAPSAVVNSVGLMAPLIFVAARFGVDAGGQFGMAERIMAAPVSLIAGAASQVLVAEITQRRRQGVAGTLRLFLRASAVLAGLGTALFVMVWLAAEPAVELVLGPGWTQCASVLPIMAATAALRLVGNPAGALLMVLQKARETVILDSLRIALVAGAIWMSIAFDLSFLQSTSAIYGALALNYIFYWCACLLAARATET
jgi:O-antigen/teichoic acid export membrane protein